MASIQPKINKLLKGLQFKGFVYLFNCEQFYSANFNCVIRKYKLKRVMNVKDYNELFPDDKKDENKYKFVKIDVCESTKQIDILKALIEIYKGEC